MRVRHTLRRWHIWLGWLVGVPMLFWTLSGVVMVWKPIEEVRGADLLRDPPAVRIGYRPIPPATENLSLERLALEPRAAGPRWVIQANAAPTRLADPQTGRLLPPLSAADAAREVTSRYTGPASIAAITRTAADSPPLDLRRPLAAWQVRMSDGTHFYIDAGSGEVIARRTRWWRIYDWMWGLHIMDLDGREDTHNPWLVGFGIAALITTLLALVLLPFATRRRRKS
ncbi:MAG TPA: PepSY domain-containing protein [Sphingomicrobium sp.]|jgi:hypothetical protein|nr:PepSY domain-containing protein [Sphingomicrobium sp.]